jgi:hypothetical protein
MSSKTLRSVLASLGLGAGLALSGGPAGVLTIVSPCNASRWLSPTASSRA